MFTVSSVPKSPAWAECREKGILMCCWGLGMGVIFHGKKNNCCQEELIFVAEIQGVMESVPRK